MSDLLEKTKRNLRSVLISEKGGVAADRLERDYRDLVSVLASRLSKGPKLLKNKQNVPNGSFGLFHRGLRYSDRSVDLRGRSWPDRGISGVFSASQLV